MQIKKLVKILLTLCAFGLNVFIFFAQNSMKNQGNQELYRIAFYGTEKEDNFITYEGKKHFVAIEGIDPFIAGECIMATSMLAAEGSPPPKPSLMPRYEAEAPFEFHDDTQELRTYDTYLSWLEMYSPRKAADSNTRTCWTEGKAGPGTCEIVLIYIEEISTPVEIWTGYGRSAELFYKNNRPKEANVYVLEALDGAANQYAVTFRNLIVLGKRKVLLEDKNSFQPLLLPDFQKIKQWRALFIAIEILSVYPGTAYNDTCISEIRICN